jgi:hypothetical protein
MDLYNYFVYARVHGCIWLTVGESERMELEGEDEDEGAESQVS